MAVVQSELGRSNFENDQLPLLMNGDRLDQKTFHALYEQMPEGFRAELIGGIVFVASPVRYRHRRSSYRVSFWLGTYHSLTPGVEGLGEGTVILGPEDEPEPDGSLCILAECGGKTREEGGYQVGTPELVAEIAVSSVAIDLGQKKEQYEKAGVDEYIVFVERDQEIHWFLHEGGSFQEQHPGPDGLFRSRLFPGLWLDPEAFWTSNLSRLRQVVEQGCATPEHADFVARLAAARAES